MRDLLPENRPLLILAPMQDITDLPFWRVMSRYGGPDVYYTEYFRVHRDSRPEKYILRSIEENPDGQAGHCPDDRPGPRGAASHALDLQKRKIAASTSTSAVPRPSFARRTRVAVCSDIRKRWTTLCVRSVPPCIFASQ